MSNDPRPARQLLLPAADFGQRHLPLTRQTRRRWFRIHKCSAGPNTWGRFSHHRFSHPDCPCPLLYVAATIQTCLALFGRNGLPEKLAMIALGELNDIDTAVDWLHERRASLV